jgi:hypothetical protein
MKLPALNDPATQVGVAAILDVDPATISRLAAKGVFPKGGTILKWLRAGWSHRGELLAGRGGDATEELAIQRGREAKANADLKELQYQKELGNVVLVADIEPMLAAWMTSTRVEIEVAFDKFAADIAMKHDIVIPAPYIEKFVCELLNRLSEPPAMGAEPVVIDQVDDD